MIGLETWGELACDSWHHGWRVQLDKHLDVFAQI